MLRPDDEGCKLMLLRFGHTMGEVGSVVAHVDASLSAVVEVRFVAASCGAGCGNGTGDACQDLATEVRRRIFGDTEQR